MLSLRALRVGLIAAAFGPASIAAADPPARLAAARETLSRPAQPLAVPERVRLLSVARVGQRLVAVGEQGTIVLSDDSGRRWRAAKAVATSVTLTQVRFADQRHGWAVGHFGVVLRSTDGGDNWTRVLDGEKSAGVALTAAQASLDPQRTRVAAALRDDGPDKPLLDLRVDGPDAVTVVGAYDTAFRSEDGGVTWRDDRVGEANPKSLHLYGVARIGAAELRVGETGLLLRRERAAEPFTRLASPFPGTFNGVLVVDDRQTLIFGLRGKVLRTLDQGSTWSMVNIPGESAINCAVRIGAGTIALGDQSGRVLISRDGGGSFQPLNRGGVPITGLAEAPDGMLVATTLVGVTLFPAVSVEPQRR